MKRIFLIVAIWLSGQYGGPLLAQSAPSILYDSKGKPAPGVMYPRLIRLEHYSGSKGAILATFEHYIEKGREPSFPIYRSLDEGKTWTLFSRVTDTKNHFGMRYQPQLFELPQVVAGMPAGTILCAGSSIPKDMSSTELLLYKSSDGGKTWEYMSSIVKGGGAGPTIPVSAKATENFNATGKVNDPVWEPFLALDKKGRLVCFYSDEREKQQGYNQLLSHQVSEDGGRTWGKEVYDVAVPDKIKRPGMIVTARLPNGKYIMVYEVVGIEHNPVYCRFSDDGDNWGDPSDLQTRIVDASNGFFMSGTPYIIWVPGGGPNGTLVVTAKGSVQHGRMVGEGFMINSNLGKGSWQFRQSIIKYDAGRHSGGYSRSMLGLDGGKTILLLTPVPVKGNLADLYVTREKIID